MPSPHVTLRQLRVLLAVAEHEGFGRAGDSIGLSQPAVSQAVRGLEAELGVSLFDRSVAPFALTPVGERVVARARAVLDQVGEIRTEAALDSDAEGGALRLGLFPTLGPYLLPHVVAGVPERFPRLKLLLTEEKSADLMPMLESGRLDAVAPALPCICG